MTDERRVQRADDVGVVVAAVVFVVLASMPWYVATLGPGERLSFRAWDLGLTAVLSVVLSLYAAGRVVWLRVRPLGPDVPLAPGVEPLAAATLATLLVLYRCFATPGVPLAAVVDRTSWLGAALLAVTAQLVFAARAVARTGIRA